MTNRDAFVKLIQTSLSAGRADFARFAAIDWLSSWPGDLTVLIYLARAEMELGLLDSAIERARKIITVDPEQIDAYEILASGLRAKGRVEEAHSYHACARILKNEPLDPKISPAWSMHLQEAMSLVRARKFDAAIAKAAIALTADPQLVLPTYSLMSIHRAAGQKDAALSVAQNGFNRWPDCVAFLLLLGKALIDEGDAQNGVDMLHCAASNDPSAQITQRIIGENHSYTSLWPEKMTAELSRPIPAEVASNLGDNRLSMPSEEKKSEPVIKTTQCDCDHEAELPPVKTGSTARGEGERPVRKVRDEALPLPQPWEAFRGPNAGEVLRDSEPQEVSETLLDVDSEFRRMAQRLNARRRARDEDGRSPAYIVISSRSRLIQHFDEDGFKQVDEQILRLVEGVRRRYGWTAYRIYIDDPHTLEPFSLSPVDPGNAWQIKLRLADLDRALGRRGEMIAAVLIVGGDSIIPFHLLPNPTDDDDDVIPSDNPYATSDENYFIPEWPVGRLPGEDEPELILRQLAYAVKNHKTQAAPRRSVWDIFNRWGLRFARILTPKVKTMGYSASIWRKASFAVFKTIGDPDSLITSPPIEASKLPSQAMRPSSLSYFNLHGLEDTPEWYGQRDPLRDHNAPIEFPVALRPSDVINSGRAPKVVFTEACYGANSIGKTSESALSLKFLNSGSRAVVGSTKISYGSVTPPLIAADLLGQHFWQYLNQRLPVGEALRRAKMKLAAEMHQRQGYLDGEDQKTLISFVLYGDPLFQYSPTSPRPGEKTVIRRAVRPSLIKTAFALGDVNIPEEEISPATMKRIEHIVAQYLPGMQEAVCTIHRQEIHCRVGDHAYPFQHFQQKGTHGTPSGAMVITLSKQVADGQRRHPHFARLTLDPQGKVMKLAVSR
jgi:tetratricopeptide (TPR) repeat protein